MIKLATKNDFEFVKSVMTHPTIYPHIADDGCSIEQVNIVIRLSLMNICLIPDDKGCFVFIPINSATLEMHSNVLPEYRGKQAVQALNECIGWIKDKTGFKKVMAYIPDGNGAYALLYKCGFRKEGVLTKSWLKNGVIKDMTLMGKEV